MKTRSSLPALAFLVLAALLATSRLSSAVVPDHGPSAFGQGSFFFHKVTGATQRWTYSFDAASNKHGQTRGRATFDIVENFVQTHVVVKIDCLNVTSDASILTAVMTGTVLRSDDPTYPKRANVLFVAEDHGVNPDVITPLSGSGGDCHTGPLPLTLLQQPPDAIHIQP